jgi:hypothetical protein
MPRPQAWALLVFISEVHLLRSATTMPPPHSYKLLWSPTFVMNQSTMTHPDGNRTGPEGAAQLAVDARYGLIAFDGAFQGCLSARGAYGSCTHAQNLSVIEEQARHIKARNPHTKVFTYRNIELALSRDGPDCRKMYDEHYAGFFLRRQDGHVLDEPSSAVNVSRLSECRAVDDNQSHYSQRDQYFIDWRNQSAVDWWLDEVVGSVARSHWVDGFFCACLLATSPMATSLLIESPLLIIAGRCLQGTIRQQMVAWVLSTK